MAEEAPLRRARGTLAVAGLVFGMALVGLVKHRLACDDVYRVGPLQAVWERLPPGLEGRERTLLAGPPLLAGPRSLFDRDLPQDLAAALLKRPWVRQVLAIRRRPPNRIRVKLRLRRPLALLRVGAERLALDGEGVVLEEESSLHPPGCPRLWIPGRPIRRVPRTGGRFKLSAVQEGLAVLEALQPALHGGHPALEGFVLEDVLVGEEGYRRRPGAADIHLRLDSGLLIDWGRSPRSPLKIFEPSTREKLDLLARVRRAYPGYVGLERVDLRSRLPLAARRE